jgi:hypothetical protein
MTRPFFFLAPERWPFLERQHPEQDDVDKGNDH